jgi:hypothetical protein
MPLGMSRLRLARSSYTDYWWGKADKSDGISTQSRYTVPCTPDTIPPSGRRLTFSRPKGRTRGMEASMSPWLTWAEGPWNTQLFAAEARTGGVAGRPCEPMARNWPKARWNARLFAAEGRIGGCGGSSPHSKQETGKVSEAH